MSVRNLACLDVVLGLGVGGRVALFVGLATLGLRESQFTLFDDFTGFTKWSCKLRMLFISFSSVKPRNTCFKIF